jgi:hypothetical protein
MALSPSGGEDWNDPDALVLPGVRKIEFPGGVAGHWRIRHKRKSACDICEFYLVFRGLPRISERGAS